jgi:hypothetical protein
MKGPNCRTVVATILIAIGSGCSQPETIVIQPDLTLLLPPRPVLPRIQETELRCLTQPTYDRLYERQRLVREYSETCEAIVRSTAPKVNGADAKSKK